MKGKLPQQKDWGRNQIINLNEQVSENKGFQ